MAPEGERRGDPESGEGDFEGRDLLVGRPEGTEGRQSAGAAGAPPVAASSQRGPHDAVVQEILETVRATAARIDELRDVPGPEHEAAEALARETAALTQVVEDARGALVKAAELAARRDGQESTEARALAEAAAALKTQGAALDKRLRATGKQAEATAQQAEAAADGIEDLKQTARALDIRLSAFCDELLRIAEWRRWRHWRFGLGIAAASFVFFVLGAVLQREAGVVSFGDPRDEWNEFVAEHYAPTIAACASEARTDNVIIGCRLRIHPLLDVTIPLYPDIILTDVPPEEQGDSPAEP